MDRLSKHASAVIFAGVVSLLTTGPLWAQFRGAGFARPQAFPAAMASGLVMPGALRPFSFGLSPTPFFSGAAARTQLGLDDRTFGVLRQVHNEAVMQFNRGLSLIGSNATVLERAQQIQGLQSTFNQRMMRAAQTAISNPAQVQRFNQLLLQSQGFGAFGLMPVRRQLNLTPLQIGQLHQFAQRLNDVAFVLQLNAQANPLAPNQQFLLLRQKALRDINAVLTPQQQLTWQQMTGGAHLQSADFFP